MVQGTERWGGGVAEAELAPRMQVSWATRWLLHAAAQNLQVWAIAPLDKASALKPSQGSDTPGLDGWVPLAGCAALRCFLGCTTVPSITLVTSATPAQDNRFFGSYSEQIQRFSPSQGEGTADSRLLSPEQLTKIN